MNQLMALLLAFAPQGPIPTTVEYSDGPTAITVPVGLGKGEDPAGLYLADGEQVLETDVKVIRWGADERPFSVLLRAVDPDGVTEGIVVLEGGEAGVGWPQTPSVVEALGSGVESRSLPFVIDSIDGHTEGGLFDVVDSVELGPVVWTATGTRSMGVHGGLTWQARAWVGVPAMELDLLWNNADALDPDPILRGVAAVLSIPPGWNVVTPWAYPGLRVESGRVVLGEGQSLPMMRSKSWRLVFALPVEGGLEAAQRLADAAGFGVPVPGSPRSLTATDGSHLRYGAHDEPMPTLAHLGGHEAAYTRARDAWKDWSAAVAAGQPLTDDPEKTKLPALHGWTYSWGARTGGPTGGLGIGARPHVDMAMAGSPAAIRALRLHQWATEGRGLGILLDGGALLSLPVLGDPAPAHWPADLGGWIGAGTLAGTNYELDRGAGEHGSHARGWLSGSGDPFGVRSVERRSSSDEGAARYEAALLGLAPNDRQHGILAMRDRIPLAGLTGDWLATFELQGLADAYRWAAYEGAGGNARLGNLVRGAEGRPHNGWPTGREMAWSARCLAEAYSLTPPGERDRWAGWLDAAARGFNAAVMPSGGLHRNHNNGNYAPKMTPPDRPERRALGQPWEDDLLRDGMRALADVASLSDSGATWTTIARAGEARERWWIPSLRTWFAYGATADTLASEPYGPGEAPARAWSWKQPQGQIALPTYQGLSGEAAAERPLDWDDPLMTNPGQPYTDDYYVGLSFSAAFYGVWHAGLPVEAGAPAAAQLVPWLGDDPWARLTKRGWNSIGMDAPLVWWLEERPWSTFQKLAQ